MNSWKKFPYFKGFSEEELRLLSALITEEVFAKDQYLMKEGEKAETLFFIDQGEVEVLKQEKSTGEIYQISKLGSGNSVGEMALIDPVRSASVKATQGTKCYVLSIKKLDDLALSDPLFEAIKTKLTSKFAGELDVRLRFSNEKVVSALQTEVENSHRRIQLSYFLITVTVFVYLYVVMQKVLMNFVKEPHAVAIMTNAVILLFTLGVVIAIIKSHYPWSFYGVSLRNAKKAFIEGVLFTIPLLIAMVILKWIIIHTVHPFEKFPLFDFLASYSHSPEHNMGTKTQLYLLLAFVFLVPLQELSTRGGFQSSFEHFFQGKHRKLTANLMTNVYFSAFHLHQSYIFAALVFFLGIFWGLLYSRHGTLISPIISHILVGVFGFMFLDISAFFVF